MRLPIAPLAQRKSRRFSINQELDAIEAGLATTAGEDLQLEAARKLRQARPLGGARRRRGARADGVLSDALLLLGAAES